MAIAIAIGVVISILQIACDYRQELLRNDAQVERILDVVSGGASQAAFELNETEADAVLRPLLVHPFFSSVSIENENGVILAEISRDVQPHFDNVIFAPLSPPDKTYEMALFHATTGLAVGRIFVAVDSVDILHDLHIRAARTVLIGVVRSAILAAMLIFVFNRILTRPIVDLVDQLDRVEAQNPKEIEVPERVLSANNELTSLAHSINQSLSANRAYLHEVKEAQEQTELVADKLRHSERLSIVGQLVGGVSHDFNNILGAVLGSFEVLKEENDLTDDAKELVNIGVTAAQRGAKVTSQLLSYSRKHPLKPQPIEVEDYLWDLKNLLALSFSLKYNVEVVVSEGLWPCFADANQLETALLNLAVNARDAMPDGGVLTLQAFNVELDAEYCKEHDQTLEPGQYVCFSVEDRGAGMNDETLDQVFEPYFTTKEIGKGTGLGLPMVCGFAKQSGGHVKIVSQIGRGTIVRLYLPQANLNAENGLRANSGANITATELTMSPSTSSDIKLLVVEDDPSFSKALPMILSSLNIKAHIALDATDALNAIRDVGPFNAALIDVILPGGMNGRQLADILMDDYPKMHIALMSGYTDDVLVYDKQLGGGLPFLQKPFSIDDLKRFLKEFLLHECNSD